MIGQRCTALHSMTLREDGVRLTRDFTTREEWRTKALLRILACGGRDCNHKEQHWQG